MSVLVQPAEFIKALDLTCTASGITLPDDLLLRLWLTTNDAYSRQYIGAALSDHERECLSAEWQQVDGQADEVQHLVYLMADHDKTPLFHLSMLAYNCATNCENLLFADAELLSDYRAALWACAVQEAADQGRAVRVGDFAYVTVRGAAATIHSAEDANDFYRFADGSHSPAEGMTAHPHGPHAELLQAALWAMNDACCADLSQRVPA